MKYLKRAVMALVYLSISAPLALAAPGDPPDRRQQRCAQLQQRGAQLPWWCGGREAAPPAGLEDACVDNQWVGYRFGAACPPADSPFGVWTVTEPFGAAQDENLRRLCKYTWAPTDLERPEPDVDALPDEPDTRLARDCDVVAAHALPDPVDQALFEAWSAQLELPDWSNAVPHDVDRIRVAVVDGGYGGLMFPLPPETQPHPEAVSSAIRAVTCPEKGAGSICTANVPNYNALLFVLRDVRGEVGGFFGRHFDFVDGVTRAVDQWLAEPVAIRPPHLILNLSIGWDAKYGTDVPERLPALAGLWAVHYARCQGALVIAAAGNQATPGEAGPLAPAVWETLPRDCPGQNGKGKKGYAPLVHAVGGVDGRDQPLAVSRVGATPRLVAPGSQVVVPLDTLANEDVGTVVLTGTSMSAAAVSGAAAMVWALRPELDADEVMELIYDAAEPLNRHADFGFKKRKQRRLSVARAFAAACPEGVVIGNCPPLLGRPVLPAPRPAGGDASVAFADLAGLFLGALEIFADPNAPDPGGSSAYLEPYVVPQPGSPGCPICGFEGTKLNGQLDPALQGAQLGTPVVVIKPTVGDSFEIKLGPLPDDQPFVVDLANELGGVTISTAWLLLPVTENGKTTVTSSELFVY